MTTCPGVHTVVSNLERFILGRHHAIAGKHAVHYLGEFAYRLNRRNQESNLFAMLLDTGTKVKAMTYPELKAAEVNCYSGTCLPVRRLRETRATYRLPMSPNSRSVTEH